MASKMPQIKEILPATAIGHATLLKKLSPVQIFVYNMLFSLCYKGNCYKRMRQISYIYVANELNNMYGLNISKRQVRRAVDKIVRLGLVERKTAVFVKLYGTRNLPTKTSYYRICT